MDVFQQSSACDVGHSLDVDPLHRGEDRLHVDPRGLEQRLAQKRCAGVAGQRLLEIGARNVEDLPDQREPVGMGSARREPEKHVARDDRGAVDGLRLLDDADGEAGEIVFAGDEALGCSAVSPPMSAQPASSHPLAIP
jgi:hypothetical protein